MRKKERKKERKNVKIQFLRGLSIMAVVMIHTCPGGYWQVVCRPFINFAVALFLFLSGYLTNVDTDNWGALFKKRILRVAIPYIIWTIIYTIPSFSFFQLLKNLVTSNAAATLYYILVYIQFVLLTPLLGRLAKSRLQWIGWLVSPISIIIFNYTGLVTGEPLSPVVSLIWGKSCLGWFTFYYLGLLLGNNLISKTLNVKALIILYLISLPIQIAEGYVWLLQGISNCGTQIKLSSLLTSSLFLLISYCYLKNDKIQFAPKAFTFSGDYSFGVYLSHILVIIILRHFCPFYSSLPFILNSAVVLSISLFGVYLGNRICGHKLSRWLGFA